MNANSSPSKPSRKQAALSGFAAAIFHYLRQFWLTALALLIVVYYGLHHGWSAQRQWSDGFCFASLSLVVIAAITLMAPPGEALDASLVRYVKDGNISETRHELFLETLHKRKFALATFLGGLLTFLIAEIVLWV